MFEACPEQAETLYFSMGCALGGLSVFLPWETCLFVDWHVALNSMRCTAFSTPTINTLFSRTTKAQAWPLGFQQNASNLHFATWGMAGNARFVFGFSDSSLKTILFLANPVYDTVQYLSPSPSRSLFKHALIVFSPQSSRCETAGAAERARDRRLALSRAVTHCYWPSKLRLASFS